MPKKKTNVLKLADLMIKTGEVSPLILPAPSTEDPYSEITYIFNWVSSLYTSDSSASNFKNSGLAHYVRYLNDTNDFREGGKREPFKIAERWDEYCLVRYKSWLDDNNIPGTEHYLASKTVPGIISAIRIVIQMAMKEGLTASRALINIKTSSGIRETTMYEAYSPEECEVILAAVHKASHLPQSIAHGYRKTNMGEDPRLYRGGWSNEANIRWYFENQMACIPLNNTGATKDSGIHKDFFKHASRTPGGRMKLYNKWGVSPLISGKLLTPLLLRLAIETGLNKESLISLQRDCFIEKHPLTGMPCLRYWKTRGLGDQDLHLSLLGATNTQDIQLKLKQARVIQKTIELILNLTSPLVDKVDENNKNDLFLYESEAQFDIGAVKSLKDSGRVYSKWIDRFSQDFDLKNNHGEEIQLNLARFRPTLFTRLVNLGVDLMVVRDIAFHKSILTTLRYLSAHNINLTARKEVSAALQTIYAGATAKEVALPYATGTNACEGVKYKGLVADCKNIFAPPARAKKLKEYVIGSPCKFFNMCLECENILVTRAHLPTLAAYRASLLASLQSQFQSPNSKSMMKHLTILDELFDPERSEFEKEDIEWALEMAQFDTVVYSIQSAVGVS